MPGSSKFTVFLVDDKIQILDLLRKPDTCAYSRNASADADDTQGSASVDEVVLDHP